MKPQHEKAQKKDSAAKKKDEKRTVSVKRSVSAMVGW